LKNKKGKSFPHTHYTMSPSNSSKTIPLEKEKPMFPPEFAGKMAEIKRYIEMEKKSKNT